MNHVIVMTVSAQHLSATFPSAQSANRGSAMAALGCCDAAAPSPRIFRTIFNCAMRCHNRLDSSVWNPVSRALQLKKDKAKTTAFLVAHIFSPSAAKSSVANRALRRKLQKNKRWQISCYRIFERTEFSRRANPNERSREMDGTLPSGIHRTRP
jgi:hypothetical protein